MIACAAHAPHLGQAGCPDWHGASWMSQRSLRMKHHRKHSFTASAFSINFMCKGGVDATTRTDMLKVQAVWIVVKVL